MAIIRHEINILDQPFYSDVSNEKISITPASYNGSCTWYFEAVSSTAITSLSLKISGTTYATITATAAGRHRVEFSTPPISSSSYYIALSNVSDNITSAKVICIQDAGTDITGTEVQIEIGSYVSTISQTLVPGSLPKYWTFKKGNWAGTASYYIEACMRGASCTATIQLQSSPDLTTWTDVTNGIITSSETTSSRVVRSSTAFTPTDNYYYRAVVKSGTSTRYAYMYNCKIIVVMADGTNYIKSFEEQYLLINEADSGSTGLQSMPTLWSTSEWSGLDCSFTYAQEAINALDSSKLVDITADPDADISTSTVGICTENILTPLYGWTTEGITSTYFGRTTTNQKVGQSFIPTVTGIIDKLKIHDVYKYSTPTDGLVVKIYSTSIEGTLLGTSETILGANMTTGTDQELTFSFSIPVSLTASTTYYFVIERTGSLSDSTYYYIRRGNAGYPSGNSWSCSSSTWTEGTLEVCFEFCNTNKGRGLNMPATDHELDTNVLVTTGAVSASKIIVCASTYDRYWVDGGGNWSDNLNHWAAISGGEAGATLPTALNDIYFDANSFTSPGSLVTNGNFATDTNADGISDNWTKGANITTYSNSDNTQFFTGVGSMLETANNNIYQGYLFPADYTTNTNKFYIGVTAKKVSGDGSLEVGSSNYAAMTNTLTTNFAFYSTIYSPIDTETDGTSLGFAATSGCPVAIKDIFVINLTATYGEGNEPTQAWCDANYSFNQASPAVIIYDVANNGCRNMDWTGVLYNPTLTLNQHFSGIYGSLVTNSSVNFTVNTNVIYMKNSADNSTAFITSNGALLPCIYLDYFYTGTLTLLDNLTVLGFIMTTNNGGVTFDTNEQALTLNHYYFGLMMTSITSSNTVNFTNSTITLTSGCMLNTSSSTGLTMIITGSTFVFKEDNIVLLNSGHNFYNVIIDSCSGAVAFGGNISIVNLTLNAGAKWKVEPSYGDITITGNFIATGTSESPISFYSYTSGNPFHIYKSSGTVNVSYCTIKDSHVSGGATFNAPTANGNTNVSGNDGWIWEVTISMKANIGGTWKTVTGVYCNIGGVWKTASAVKTNIGGTWK